MNWLLFFVFGMLASFANAEGRKANHLQGAASPYLLQHLYNPVDWYPWGPEALNKAKSEGKLIFVSVGYSACHWCHVMERESFENEAVAAALNDGFVSIKIDRESHPDLDAQFQMMTKLMTGGSGWPNSVFLTPEGDPIFAGGYFPAAEFLSAVRQVNQDWMQYPVGLRAQATKISETVSAQLQQRAKAQNLSQDEVQGIVDTLLDEMDPFTGGYGIVPKFPREPLFLYLLDHAERTGDADVLRAVTEMLDGVIRGGIHDHVGGGFHRYAVDPDWNEPHFEKMLFTQALMGRLLVRAWGITGDAEYRRAAERLLDYVSRDLRDAKGGFFAAQSAESKVFSGETFEGAYYTWPSAEIDRLDDTMMFRRDLVLSKQESAEQREVLALSALVRDVAEETEKPVFEVQAALDKQLDHLYELRQTRVPPFVDRKIIVSWNAAMLETLALAGYYFERPDYTKAAEMAARFILDEMATQTGLMRASFDHKTGVPAQLADYAGLGLGLIALHDYASSPEIARGWLREAHTLAHEIGPRFGIAKDGFRMTQIPQGKHAIVSIEDIDLPSGNAMALDLFTQLSLRTQAPDLQQAAFGLASALSGEVRHTPEKRSYFLKATQNLKRGEIGPVRFAANGAVRVEVQHDKKKNSAVVQISLAQGWHINSDRPLEDHLIPTKVVLEGARGVPVYPRSQVKTLKFSENPLALYEGDVAISSQINPDSTTPTVPKVKLTLQACSDEICLQPEELVFVLWPTEIQE